MKLHIGAGERYLPGYLHVDIIERPHIDHVADVRDLSFLQSGTAREIYARHVLEHFKRGEAEDVLREWARVLAPSGLIRVAVPDFAAITAEYANGRDLDSLLGLLYGGQNYDYNFHFQAYDFARLEKMLQNGGFTDIERYDWHDFLPKDYDDFSRAYFPHMDFENGRLMSLSVTARKK
jgi:SAM-dependent methyltransferase